IPSFGPGGALAQALENIRKMNETGRFTSNPAILEASEAARKHILRGAPSPLAMAASGSLVPSVSPNLAKSSALARAAAGTSDPVPEAAKPTPKGNVHVELSVSVGIAFPDGAPVVETMEILESQVAKTLNAFEPLFD
ncbi:MAG TPA: hypothetical protein VJ838_03610, partial [Gaiellaceae bacterium]|nr:hypothetical protein [Gaiellaceae bacterium]